MANEFSVQEMVNRAFDGVERLSTAVAGQGGSGEQRTFQEVMNLVFEADNNTLRVS